MKKKISLVALSFAAISFLQACQKEEPIKKTVSTLSIEDNEIEILKRYLTLITPMDLDKISYNPSDRGFYYNEVYQIDLDHLRISYSQSQLPNK